MKSDLVALFDMDGTLCDYDSAIKRDLKKLGIDEHDEDKYKEHVRLIKKQPDWWYNLEPIRSGFDLLNLIQALGFSIHILTKGPSHTPSAWTEKLRWCQTHVSGYPVTITSDKGLVYGKILVDDYPEYIERWLKWRPRGIVIMPVREYNKTFEHPNVIHYHGSEKGMKDLEQLLKKYYELK